MNPIGAGPSVRATLLGLFREVGATTLPDGVPALAPSVFFDLGPAPAPSEHFNALAGVDLQVPLVDADAQPLGGVRFPDVEVPLGRPEPVALAPCGTLSITDVCGNFGGWEPFDAAELARRYGSVDGYSARYADAYDALVGDGFAMVADRERALDLARRAFSRAG
jgi:Alpha/beta hydrolase domain